MKTLAEVAHTTREECSGVFPRVAEAPLDVDALVARFSVSLTGVVIDRESSNDVTSTEEATEEAGFVFVSARARSSRSSNF